MSVWSIIRADATVCVCVWKECRNTTLNVFNPGQLTVSINHCIQSEGERMRVIQWRGVQRC